MTRTNESWLEHLRCDGATRDEALRDLRELLIRNLRKAMWNRSIDDSFVEDAVQDSLIRILERLDQFQGRSRFVTWATAISIRIALGELRRSRWKDVSLHDVVSDADFVAEYAVDSEASPAEKADRQAIVNLVRHMIEDRLTDKQRTALLAELKGMPLDEIARHLGSNRNAIYKLTHDARKKLKAELEAAGYTAEDVVTTVVN